MVAMPLLSRAAGGLQDYLLLSNKLLLALS
jgi:hypothetical protein